MPKHAFRFPPEVVVSVKHHVRRAVEGLNPTSYRQEPNYTAALLGRLAGTAYEGEHGSVVFSSTVFDDRGRSSAEARFGADHAITATISDGLTTIRKAIVVQAKLGRIDKLSARESAFLREQIVKMRQLVPAPKVMEIPDDRGVRMPAIISGLRVLTQEPYRPMELADYFAARVLTTLDGCTDPSVVDVVADSSLMRVNVVARLKRKVT